MIIADKLYKLRMAGGLSQEELAEKMNVSRQSVSKWESGSSIPSLDKIVELSKIYGISTDYLLKDEIEELPGEIVADIYVKEEYRQVSLEEANEYINLMRGFAKRVAFGVMMCILSPIPLLLLGGFSEYGVIGISEDMAGGFGVAILVITIAMAVAIFILNGLKLEPYEFLEKECFQLAYGVAGIVEKEEKMFLPKFRKFITLGVVLCIIAVVPILVFAGFEASDMVMIYMTVVLLVTIAIGVYLIVVVGTEKSAYERLLQMGDYTKEKKKTNKKLEVFSGAYWCVVTAIYLGISFVKWNWHISWVIWPVAGVIYAALHTILGAVLPEKK